MNSPVEILDKFESSNNPTQKEKFEGDLKKEIKKLQRLRDQIKTWITASEVKDKRPLLEARKEIEQDMERFKVIEKETKTKAYSKEGLLSSEAKKDPLQKEKEELDEWLKQCISSLNTQTEKYEFEIESLSNNNKKKRIDKETALAIDEKRQRLEMCCFHVEKLEAIMRLLDNERLDCTKVRSIQESIEYVIDCGDNQSMLDFKNIYDDLCLDELGDSTGITAASGTVTVNQEHDLNGVITPVANLVNPRVGNDDAGSSASTHTSTSNHTDSSVNHPGSSTSSNASSSRERAKSDEKIPLLPHVSASSTSTPVKSNTGGSTGKHKSNSLANQTAPALMSQVVAGTPNKSGKSNTNSHVLAANSTINNMIDSNAVKPTPLDSQVVVDDSSRNQKNDSSQKITDRSSTTNPQLQSHNKNTPNDDLNSLSPISSVTVTNSTSPVPNHAFTTPHPKDDSSVINNREEFLTVSQSSCISSSVNSSSPVTIRSKSSEVNKTTGVTNVYNNTILSTSSSDGAEHVNHTPPSLYSAAMLAASQDKQLSSLLASSQHPSAVRGGSNAMDPSVSAVSMSSKFQSVSSSATSLPPSSSVMSTTIPQAQSSYLGIDNQVSSLQPSLHSSQQLKNHPSSPIHAHMHPRDAAAPFRNRNLDKPKGAVPQELLLQLQALESGYRRLPHPCDTERSRMIVCKNPVNCPSYYPREPLVGTDSEEYYMKLDAQTLFFIFYYFEGTKAQYLAAKALKRMSWRFHTKFMMWFQRHEEPKQITDEYESGSYIYYDFRTMRQRKKEEFMFHYSFLEDKDF
ncbi:unnamed protein product [Trichobilharzia szidati]|nr:unnamed protein product [Trichobilharzia szidati]